MKHIFTIAAAALTALAANAEVLWEGNVETGAWGSSEGVSCVKIGKASFATASEGDKLAVTISEVGAEGKLLYKDGSSWEDLVDAPAVDLTEPMTTKLTLEQTSVDVLKANGLILQGNNITITKVELTSSATFEYTTVWEGNAAITWEGENAPRSTDPILEELKAGDVIAVTVSAIGEKNDWPKCCFRSVKDEDIVTLELWDFIGEALPTVKSVVVEDPEMWKLGFYVVGCACSITKIEVGIKTGGGVSNETILWEGDPTEMTWGAGPTVSASKGAKLAAGDVMEITVSSLSATEEWPKVVCRCEDGWDEIFTVELWNDSEATFPLVKSVVITDEMLPLLAKGFNFGGVGAFIEKVAVPKNGSKVAQLVSENAPISVYNMAGIRVRANVNSNEALKDLPAGLYIVNGKKVIVK